MCQALHENAAQKNRSAAPRHNTSRWYDKPILMHFIDKFHDFLSKIGVSLYIPLTLIFERVIFALFFINCDKFKPRNARILSENSDNYQFSSINCNLSEEKVKRATISHVFFFDGTLRTEDDLKI